MKILLITGVLFLLLNFPAAELPETLARFGNIELKKDRFQRYTLPSSPGQCRAVLKNLVDTEIYLIIVRQLLQRSRIAPDALTARRYVEMRKKQFPGKTSPSLLKQLEQNISKPEFQLKCALYFTFYAADPATVEPKDIEVRQHYELNRKQFQLPVQTNWALFRAGKNDEQGKEQARLILSRLRQGEDFYLLAKKFDPEGRKKGNSSAAALGTYFKKVEKIAPGESTSVETPEAIFIVKVISRSPAAYRSFEETRLYITEMLSSARLKNSLEQYMSEMIAKNPVQYFF